MELNGVAHSLACSVLGDRETVREGLQSIIDQTGADELMLTAQIYDHTARLRSFEIGAQVRDELAGGQVKQATTSTNVERAASGCSLFVDLRESARPSTHRFAGTAASPSSSAL